MCGGGVGGSVVWGWGRGGGVGRVGGGQSLPCLMIQRFSLNMAAAWREGVGLTPRDSGGGGELPPVHLLSLSLTPHSWDTSLSPRVKNRSPQEAEGDQACVCVCVSVCVCHGVSVSFPPGLEHVLARTDSYP